MRITREHGEWLLSLDSLGWQRRENNLPHVHVTNDSFFCLTGHEEPEMKGQCLHSLRLDSFDLSRLQPCQEHFRSLAYTGENGDLLWILAAWRPAAVSVSVTGHLQWPRRLSCNRPHLPSVALLRDLDRTAGQRWNSMLRNWVKLYTKLQLS